jgi:DNA-binding PadR family transcriptional regulator
MNTLTPDDLLLGLLASGARHGYALLACFRDPAELGLVWDLSTSQLYAVLKRLEGQGLIVGNETQPPDAPPRMEYAVTESGHERLQAWLAEAAPSPSVRRVRVEFLSRLYVARLLNLPTSGIVTRQKAACLNQRNALIAERDCSPPGVGYLSLELHIAQMNAILGWIDRCELTQRNAIDTMDESEALDAERPPAP